MQKYAYKWKNAYRGGGKMSFVILVDVRWAKNVLCFHQLLCQTLLTCPNGAKTTKICIKVPNYAYKCKNMHTNAKMQIREEVTLVKM